MDFLKFFSLVRTAKLYFPSAWKLSEVDPFEGSLTSLNANFTRVVTFDGAEKAMDIVEHSSPPENWPPEEKKLWSRIRKIKTNDNMQQRKHMYINSWHMNDRESVAMWKLYGDGLAVVSNPGRLCSSLMANKYDIFVGCVQYVDYERESNWPIPFGEFIQKRISLSYESGVRAVVWEHKDSYFDFLDAQYKGRDRKLPDPPDGISLDCDLEQLIDHVVLSPAAPPWADALLRDYCAETLGKEVVSSTLRSTPYF